MIDTYALGNAIAQNNELKKIVTELKLENEILKAQKAKLEKAIELIADGDETGSVQIARKAYLDIKEILDRTTSRPL
jgi:hypothetical protein